ncbi:dihydroxyacetone kinase subunit L [Pantoea osteomyelitidis]|uniref:Dihydroxyacetone kinase subunit L n=1 Tax=Pantoea osteomyelitidis TaxID=3230026 RepID=A0ABW7Q0G6_9GAMM
MIASAELLNQLRHVCAQIPGFTAELNVLDGQLGDGDLGATLEKCAQLTGAALQDLLPDTGLSEIFRVAARACMQASGSSFGTLLAQALIVASKFSSDKTALTRPEMATLLHQIIDTLAQRGGAIPGDKTVLDGLQALAETLEKPAHPGELRRSMQAALDSFRPLPNRMGRARMFAEKSQGMDDPGMVALLRLVESLTEEKS